MSERAVPVSMGSPEFLTTEVEGFRVTHAWFPPSATLEAHIHDRPTFAIMLEGGFDLHFTSAAIRRKRLPCPAGTILTEPAGEKHANYIAPGGARVVVLQPDPERDELLRPGAAVLDRINHFRHGRIELTARRLAREVTEPDELSPLSIQALALEMLVDAARLDRQDRWEGERPPWVARAREYVHEHFRDRLRIADVAEAVDVHPAHLAATFRDTHSMPLGEYIRKLKMEWAAVQLVETDDPIASIAYRAGFADQAHLTRAFKKQTGWTPARYRKARRGNGET